MFLNGTKCDIYIGTGAGKKLMHDIENAEHSVKILSPFLSPFLVKKLISLHHRNINIQLITTDTIEDYYGVRKKNIYELIEQVVHVNADSKKSRNRLKKIRLLLNILIFVVLGIAIWGVYIFKDSRAVTLSIPVLILFFVSQFLKSKIRNKQVLFYSYKQLFPFKVIASPDKYDYDGIYLHGKIYIIDDRIAYLGSLNFTGGGTKKNYETRIKFTDTEAVQNIVDEFDTLFYNEELPEISIQSWGKYLYPEPIY